MATHPHRPAHVSAMVRRHALQLALIYALIRGFPDLLSWVWVFASEPFRLFLFEHFEAWLPRVLPPLPIELVGHVPSGFQDSLNTWSLFFIEGALVFLASAWLLSKRPSLLENGVPRRAWVVMVLATLAWSTVFRHLVFKTFIAWQFVYFNFDGPFDSLWEQVWKMYWQASVLFYVSTVVWAGLPVWLHVRALRKGVGAEFVTTSVPAMRQPLVGSCVFVSFLLGFTLMHTFLLQSLVMGLWPWLAATRDIYMPLESLNEAAIPMTLGQVLMPVIAGILAAALYSRAAPAMADSRFRVMAGPVLAGAAVLLLANLACLVLVWILAYANFGVMSGILMGLAYEPDLIWVALVVFNLFSVLLLLGVTLFVRGPRAPAPVVAAG